MSNQNSEVSTKRTLSFYLAFVIMLIPFILSVNTDLAQFSEHKDTGIPPAFFNIIFSVDALIVLSMVLIYFYKKVGVILFPILVMMHFMLHNFYLSVSLYADLFLLFVFCGAGLAVIVPRWIAFK